MLSSGRLMLRFQSIFACYVGVFSRYVVAFLVGDNIELQFKVDICLLALGKSKNQTRISAPWLFDEPMKWGYFATVADFDFHGSERRLEWRNYCRHPTHPEQSSLIFRGLRVPGLMFAFLLFPHAAARVWTTQGVRPGCRLTDVCIGQAFEALYGRLCWIPRSRSSPSQTAG